MKGLTRKEALEKIAHLFKQADAVFIQNKQLASRYVTLARKLAMKFRIRLGREYRRKYCKHCYRYIRAGINARVRTQDGHLVITCRECNRISRLAYK